MFCSVQRQQHERSLQEDDEEEEDAVVEELDIDEEAALNTNANIRATRPSFSLAKDNSLVDMDTDRMGNRISAIRFKGYLSLTFLSFLIIKLIRYNATCLFF